MDRCERLKEIATEWSIEDEKWCIKEIGRLRESLDYEKNTKLEWLLTSDEADGLIKKAGYVKKNEEIERLKREKQKLIGLVCRHRVNYCNLCEEKGCKDNINKH